MKKLFTTLLLAATLPAFAQDITGWQIVPRDWTCTPPKTNRFINITSLITLESRYDGITNCITTMSNTIPQAKWIYVGDRTNSTLGFGGGYEEIAYHSNLVIDVRCGGTNRAATLESTPITNMVRRFRFQRVYEQ